MLIRACTTGVRLATDLDSLQLALYLEWKRNTRRTKNEPTQPQQTDTQSSEHNLNVQGRKQSIN